MSEPLRQGEGIARRLFGPFEAADVARYAGVSGDDNPLHSDPALAAAAGLSRPPIHGMLMMGCFEPYLLAWRGDLRIVKLSAKFLRLVLTGEAVELSGRVVRANADEPVVIRLTVKRDADLVCLAEAFVRLQQPIDVRASA